MNGKTKKMEIKRENKKALPKLFLIIAVCAVLGFFAGFGAAWLGDNDPASIAGNLHRFWTAGAPINLPVLAVLLMIPAQVLYFREKKAFSRWDGEEEEALEKIETILSIALLLVGCFMIFIYFGMAVILSAIDALSKAAVIICLAEMLLSLFWAAVLQQKLVDLEKQINPEKQGSVYDTKFSKKWMDSCDEREQLIIYKSAYQSYKFTSTFCLVLSLVVMLGSIPFGYGPLPACIVLLVWLVMMLSYCIAAMKLEKHKKADKKEDA